MLELGTKRDLVSTWDGDKERRDPTPALGTGGIHSPDRKGLQHQKAGGSHLKGTAPGGTGAEAVSAINFTGESGGLAENMLLIAPQCLMQAGTSLALPPSPTSPALHIAAPAGLSLGWWVPARTFLGSWREEEGEP